MALDCGRAFRTFRKPWYGRRQMQDQQHVAQLEERRAEDPEGAGAEPAMLSVYQRVAQLAEHRALNPEGAGAEPAALST